MTINLKDWRLKAIQSLSRFSDTSAIEVNAILKNRLKKDLSWIFLNQDFFIPDDLKKKLEIDLEKLKQKVPLAYVLGFQEFFGLNFIVSNDVLIPRPETELIVENAIFWGKKNNFPIRILDVGTGSGCIVLSILNKLPNCLGYGLDISFRALKIAKTNAHNFQIPNIEFINSDLTSPLIGKFDLVCANLPYVPSQMVATISHSKYEPIIALDGGENGKKIINSLLDQLVKKINTPGVIFLEIQNDQGEDIYEYARILFPTSNIAILNDYSQQTRVVKIELI